jgi:DNA/RNA-binding domain of Phe-tRNA-synthetase-like protein
MYFMHDGSVWSAHSSLCATAIAVVDVRRMGCNDERVQSLTPRVRRRLATSADAEMPEIASWRDAFVRMGFKRSQYRCGAEALLRRYRREESLPRFHPFVDYLNMVSMAFAIPIAAFDCEKIAEGITVRPADGSETYETFHGDIEHPLPNEVIFADGENNAHSRRWTFRQSARSLVTSHSDCVLVVAEALHATAPQDIDALDEELSAGIAGAGGQIIASRKLSATLSRLEF